MELSESFKGKLKEFDKQLNSFLHFMSPSIETLNEDQQELYRNTRVKKFEITMDSCWKLIKKYNNEVGIESLKNPIDIIKQFYLTGIISDTDYDNLIQMWRDRNISVHLYEENSFNEILNRLPAHLKVFMTLNEIFHNEVKRFLK